MPKCIICGIDLKSKHSLTCGAFCMHQHAGNLLVEEYKENPLAGVRSGNRLKSRVREYIFSKFDNKCSQCGWCEINPSTGKSPLEIDHIDGNSANNDENNLRVLCPNCHSLTPTYKALNKGNASKERLRYFKLTTGQ